MNQSRNQNEIESLRAQILQIASERDRTLHHLPTTAASQDVHAALVALPSKLSDKGIGLSGSVNHVIRDILPALAPGHAGPRYFGFITGGALPSAQLADFLTTIYDQNVGANRTEESIAAIVEWRALEFVLDLFNLPRDKFPARILTSGATASNVLGLALARNHAVRTALNSQSYSVSEDGFAGVTVKVYSDRPHASLLKAAALVGIGRSNVIDIGKKLNIGEESNDIMGINLNELEEHLKQTSLPSSVNENKTAAVVSVSFGEVNTGDFTPKIREIRALCDKYSVWLHIDAAFGAYARLVPDIVGNIADGLELGDSIASDAHKWLNVPYDCGLFFSRSIKEQQSIFTPTKGGMPAYLSRLPSNLMHENFTPEMKLAAEIPDAMTLAIENSRRFRGLALYTALLDQGREGYAEIVRRNILFTRRIADWIESEEGKGYYEVLNMRMINVPITSLSVSATATEKANSKTKAVRTTPLNMLLFRARKGSNPVQAYTAPGGSAILVKALNETKKIQVTPGENAVRIAVSNWYTGFNHESNDSDMHHSNLSLNLQAPSSLKGDFNILIEALLSVVEIPPQWVVSASL